MGSRAESPTSTITKTAIIPRIPQDIIEEILGHLATGSNFTTLRACALVSKSWVPSCQRHLFHTIVFGSWSMEKWLKTFPIPEESPAHHVRDIRIWIGGISWVPDKFFQFTLWFTNVQRMFLIGQGGFPSFRIPSIWKLPQSVTSLTIDSCILTLLQVRDIMAHLPNLDDLSLSGSLIPVDEDALPGIGKTLRGRFGGKLILHQVHASKDVLNMLLEIPAGLHFTEMETRCTRETLPSAIRIMEACSKTIVKLSHTVVAFDYRQGNPERSFDFSKLPNLQEVNLGVGRINCSPHWIPTALSTLRPATNPRLSAVRLDFAHVPTVTAGRPVTTLTEDLGDDLQRVAVEVTRIEHEFEGTVDITVLLLQNSGYQAVLDALGVTTLRQYGG